MKFPCIEATLDVCLGGRTVRVWIDQTETQSLTWDHDYAGIVEQLRRLGELSTKALIERVVELVPNVNAIQIRRGEIGIVAYLVEFAEKG